VNPAQCVSTIFALMVDDDEFVRDNVFKSAVFIKEKWPHFLLKKVVEGFHLSFTFRKRVFSGCKAPPSAIQSASLFVHHQDTSPVDLHPVCYFSSLYTNIIRDNLEIRYFANVMCSFV
jgi:hypothetical protein